MQHKCNSMRNRERKSVGMNALFPAGAALVFGASGGIGGKIAEVLASDGSDLALVCNRKPDAAAAVAATAQALGRTATSTRRNDRICSLCSRYSITEASTPLARNRVDET